MSKATGTADAGVQPRKKGLPRRQRRRLSRGAQYVLFVAAVIVFAVTADWGRLQNQFAQADIAGQMFPDVITLALRNTVLYTVSGFAVGLVLGIVLALMRLSSVGPYRWVAGVTHEMSFAREVADRVVFMDGGVVVEDGTPDQVIGHPRHERTRHFLSRLLDPARAEVEEETSDRVSGTA
ncbi:hypothetical protein ACWDA7_29440 [Streptomyces sp. NPDC001156]